MTLGETVRLDESNFCTTASADDDGVTVFSDRGKLYSIKPKIKKKNTFVSEKSEPIGHVTQGTIATTLNYVSKEKSTIGM